MKKILSIIVCSVCCGVTAAQTYTLQQLKDSALHNNIAIRNARHSIDAAQQQRKEALTKYFPNISGTNGNKSLRTNIARIRHGSRSVAAYRGPRCLG